MASAEGWPPGLSARARFVKRTFDIAGSSFGLVLLGWLMLLSALAATIDTRRNGFFVQQRVGRYGKPISVVKIRTMRDVPGLTTTVTASGDPRVTSLGRFLRWTKIDELPQLANVFVGQMSFVGPRPDVVGFADRLRGEDRVILTVRPGITGPATLAFKREEALLAVQADPTAYNRDIIFPEKVRLNREYVVAYRFVGDIACLWHTLTGRNDRYARRVTV